MGSCPHVRGLGGGLRSGAGQGRWGFLGGDFFEDSQQLPVVVLEGPGGGSAAGGLAAEMADARVEELVHVQGQADLIVGIVEDEALFGRVQQLAGAVEP